MSFYSNDFGAASSSSSPNSNADVTTIDVIGTRIPQRIPYTLNKDNRELQLSVIDGYLVLAELTALTVKEPKGAESDKGIVEAFREMKDDLSPFAKVKKFFNQDSRE